MPYIHAKECKACQNVYSRKEVSKEQFDTLSDDVCETDEGNIAYINGEDIVTTLGCCDPCAKEYHESEESE